MNSLAVAGFLIALMVAHATVAAYCLLAFARRRAEPELLLFGLLNVAIVVADGASAGAYAAAGDFSAHLVIGRAARIAAAVFLIHYVVRYTRIEKRRWALPAVYAVGSVFEIANAVGGFARYDGFGARSVWLFGLEVPNTAVPPTAIGIAGATVWLAGVLFAVGALGRAYVRGRREGPAVAGVVVLAVTITYDAARTIGWVSGPILVPYGYTAFVYGMIMTLLSRFTALRRQLETRAATLKNRARNLAAAYDELRTAQDAIVRKEQLAAVGELSAVIAHEVRNPLAIITNAVATLRRRDIKADDHDLLLGILDEESSRLNRLVGDLLRYARPVNIERQLVSLREITDRATALTRSRTDVVVELTEPRPVEKIWGDADLLRQVIENLINNGMQAMASGGTLTLTLEDAELEGDCGVELHVGDTGEGMDTQVRSRALDPFFTTRPAGTGLGLAIVARIVDAHGGRLRITSSSGAGTVVRVFLPIAGESPSSRHRERGSSVPPIPIEVRRALDDGNR